MSCEITSFSRCLYQHHVSLYYTLLLSFLWMETCLSLPLIFKLILKTVFSMEMVVVCNSPTSDNDYVPFVNWLGLTYLTKHLTLGNTCQLESFLFRPHTGWSGPRWHIGKEQDHVGRNRSQSRWIRGHSGYDRTGPKEIPTGELI